MPLKYLSKNEEVMRYLKNVLPTRPISFIPIEDFVAQVCYDCLCNEKQVMVALNRFEQLGIIEIDKMKHTLRSLSAVTKYEADLKYQQEQKKLMEEEQKKKEIEQTTSLLDDLQEAKPKVD